MALKQSMLRNYASSKIASKKSSVIVNEALNRNRQTAFLSHSHKDATLAKAVQSFLQSNNWEVYIDWQDQIMPEEPDRQTASRIQNRIKELDWFLFLATDNSMKSRWCPWEIGYADGIKNIDEILIIPTEDDYGSSFGNEYLQLYQEIGPAKGGGYGVFPPNRKGMLLEKMTVR